MMLTRSDTILRAHEVGRGLSDLERIALGVTLAETVLDPDYAPYLAYAAGSLRDHAAALSDLKSQQPDGPCTGQTITHEQMGHSGSFVPSRAKAPGPRAWQTTPQVARGPGTIRVALTRLNDSLVGDLIGGLSLAVIAAALFFLPLFFGQ